MLRLYVRYNRFAKKGPMAQLVERLPCTEEVSGSNPLGSIYNASALLDSHSTPIKCNLKVKKIDGSFIEFFDLCWASKEIVKILERESFKISQVKGLGGGDFFNNYEPFIFYKAV